MGLINGFISISLVVTILFGFGFLYFLSDFEQEKCEMTYMFEYPHFMKIPNGIKYDQFLRYGLYAYTEGRYTTKVRSMYFDGIPVLFVPGNAGSYKQVRSLSSVALRKALNSRSPYHFDYFTVDLNSEYSGLYGPLLYDQIEYVNYSLSRIFDLYTGRHKPKSVIIIGHSMGGVIAKKLVSRFQTDSIYLIITLAAPLKRPPMIFDYYLNEFYNYHIENDNTIIISISGGYSDFLVPPYLNNINGDNFLSTLTTNIPRCWIEVNHVEIVWCKQIVLAISRALFDSIDLQTKQLTQNLTYVNMVFKHHLVHHNSVKPQKLQSYSKIVKVDYKGIWIENLLRQYSVEFLHGVNKTHWYMIKLASLPTHEMLTVVAINFETINWIFACNAHLPLGKSKVCNEAVHLTQMSEIAPSVKYKRRYLQINMHELRKTKPELTHVIVRALPTSEPVAFHVDVHDSGERRIDVDLPNWWNFKKTFILEETIAKAVHYELVMMPLEHVFQFYQLFVEPLKCLVPIHHASATLVVPWGNQNYHTCFTNSEKKPLNMRLYTSKPYHFRRSAFVRLILDPSCTYQIRIKSSIFGSLGQVARIYTPLLLTNVASVLLMTLKYQIRSLKHGYCPIFFVALKHGAKPYYIIPIVKGSSILFSKIGPRVGLPMADTFYLSQDGVELFASSILLFVCGVGFAFVLGAIYIISIVTLDSIVRKLYFKLGRRICNIINLDFLVPLLHKVPLIATAILILISISICGGLALCLGALFYFIKLTNMAQDCIEKIVLVFIKQFAEYCKTVLQNKTRKSNNPDCFISRLLNKDLTEMRLEKTNTKHSLNKNSAESSHDYLFNKLIGNENEEVLHKRKWKSEEIKRNGDIITNESKLIQQKKSMDKGDTNNELAPTYNALFFHSTVFFLWCIVTIINFPALLTWAHNLEFNISLAPDTSFIPGLVLSLCCIPLWQFELPKIRRKWSTEMETLISITVVLSLIFATVSLYRLNYLLTLIIVFIVLHQVVAPESI